RSRRETEQEKKGIRTTVCWITAQPCRLPLVSLSFIVLVAALMPGVASAQVSGARAVASLLPSTFNKDVHSFAQLDFGRCAKIFVVLGRSRVAGRRDSTVRLGFGPLLQLGVLVLGLLQDRDVGVGVFPELEEVFVRCARVSGVAGKGQCPGKLHSRKGPHPSVHNHTLLSENLAKLCRTRAALASL